MSWLRTDRILIVDFENTCWEKDAPPGQKSEIIEIGVAEVAMRDEPRITRSAGWLVRPQNSVISAYCTDLTGISQDEVRTSGRPLQEVLNSVGKTFGGSGKLWAAWGNDKEDLDDCCRAYGCQSPFSENFLNLGHLWSVLISGRRNIGLDNALDHLELAFEGRRHRAEPDAVNAARVLVKMAQSMRNIGRQD